MEAVTALFFGWLWKFAVVACGLVGGLHLLSLRRRARRQAAPPAPRTGGMRRHVPG
jgi:hypothetical protein